jgi:NAD(P)-dependent dehydrogenase (short-subunit alcohol dehydrogenase family)
MFDLAGRVVVVTGAGTGIGRGIVRAMARAGATIVIAGRTPETLEAAAAEARDLGADARAVRTDITVRDQVDALVATTMKEFGRIHCWVNNAGSANADDVGALIDLNEAQWDAVIDLNLKWTFFAAQAAARAMATTGGGSIINISSRSGSYPCPNTGQYGAAKAGLDNLTATMAAEWGHLGIRVNAVAPGVVITEANAERMTPTRTRRQVQTVPLQRLGTPDDIGPLCVYLASDESSWQSGTVVHVNGGSPIPVGYLTYLHHVNSTLP